jgi:hypothetical protein
MRKQKRDKQNIQKMSPELIRYTRKVDSFREVLKEHGFEKLECFWYSDGSYTSKWRDMSVANEKPDREESMSLWQFGFKSQNEKNKRIYLEALMPVFEDYFKFDLRFYPQVQLHDREGYSGPTAVLFVSNIMEEDLTDLQKYINYILNIS